LAVAFIDLDGLKRVNDTSGHSMGDRFIREVSRLLREVKRASDEVCRMGGDEFMMILPDTASEEAHRMMDRLTGAAACSSVLQAMGPGPWISYGIVDLLELAELADLSSRSPNVSETLLQHLIHIADTRMYEEKRRHYDAHHYRSRHDFHGSAGDP
ncbi:MAG: GGDEF domain-containing protein, partial [Alkalispirochaeta sp.]